MRKSRPLPNGLARRNSRSVRLVSRRRLLQAGGIVAATLSMPALARGLTPHIVILGGGFGGASCARAIVNLDPTLKVTLVEANPVYTACPLSNCVLAGIRELKAQQFGYDNLQRARVEVVNVDAVSVDTNARRIVLSSSNALTYDRLVLAPGIDFRWNAIPGYSERVAGLMPHAWKAGGQTELLRQQLEAMQDGGLVVISVPAQPYRCPPGPYERASLIAHFLKAHKPRSKLILLDAKDQFPKQRLFQKAWVELYGTAIEWVPLSSGGNVVAIDASSKTLITDFGRFQPAVANVIPPQKAGQIADRVGATDRSGWCPVDPVTFESRLLPGVHVIGDAAFTGGMPKSAFAANAEAKVCALAIARLLRGEQPTETKMINACYSLLSPDYAISTVGIYHPVKGELSEVDGAGGASALDASPAVRAREARLALSSFNAIAAEAFG